ncbi:hypothetical protein [Candidatus Palauibacter sp.]|uniref:hypothetical protein n=1 Tax=Candidatus Palauibacter sp. TaxID=3101350 RepID=UPI003C6FB53B
MLVRLHAMQQARSASTSRRTTACLTVVARLSAVLDELAYGQANVSGNAAKQDG